jgi:hypothetical protein
MNSTSHSSTEIKNMCVEGRGGVPRHGDGSAVPQGQGGQVRGDQIHPGN